MAARRAAPAASGRELTSRKSQVDTVRNLLERFRPQMEVALPKHLSADRMARLFMTCVANEPKLLECTQASLVGSVIQLSQLGLEPGILGHAYLIPFRNKGVLECQVIPGYKGLLKLARNSGQILSVQANVVREHDHFVYQYGLHPVLEHIPSEDDLGELRYAYAVVGIKGSEDAQWEVMNKREIFEVKKASRAGDTGPWVTHEPEMWKKTVLRRICKLLPSSIELQTAIALDEAADSGIPQAFDVIDIDADTGAGDSPTNGNGA